MTDRTLNAAVEALELFNHKAATWSAKYAPGSRLTNRISSFVAALSYHLPAEGRVLDLGCGTGELARVIAARGMQATGAIYRQKCWSAQSRPMPRA